MLPNKDEVVAECYGKLKDKNEFDKKYFDWGFINGFYTERYLIALLNKYDDIEIINKIKKFKLINIYAFIDCMKPCDEIFMEKYTTGVKRIMKHNIFNYKQSLNNSYLPTNILWWNYKEIKKQRYNAAIIILAAKKYGRSDHPLFEQPKEIVNRIVDAMLSSPLTEFDDGQI